LYECTFREPKLRKRNQACLWAFFCYKVRGRQFATRDADNAETIDCTVISPRNSPVAEEFPITPSDDHPVERELPHSFSSMRFTFAIRTAVNGSKIKAYSMPERMRAMLGDGRRSSPVLTVITSLLAWTLSVAALEQQAPAGSGAAAVQSIDWNSVGPGAPIPRAMPMADSDDPVEAGFAPEWIRRAVAYPFSTPSQREFALAVVAEHRTADDRWAREFEAALREIVRGKVRMPTVARVFCNSVGCLCYVQAGNPFDSPLVYTALHGQGVQQRFGITPADVDVLQSFKDPNAPWELTFVRRPARRGQ